MALLPLLHTPPGQEARPPAAIEENVEVVRVIDGDTLVVRLDGRETTVRLAFVDTEEKISGRPLSSPSKPETIFGQETALWAQDFFAALGTPPHVGLSFPEGRREDVYGRLLARVILPDGRDFDRLLVELGRSPYFNKYGNSRTDHEEFVRAQDEARRRQLGLWNPATNRARTEGAPSAVRPYEKLIPWWNARAAAIDEFRRRREADPAHWISPEDETELVQACERCRKDPALRVTLFTTVERFFEEADGSLTVLLRGYGKHDVRARLGGEGRTALEGFLRSSTEEFRQNYLCVEGRLERDARGIRLVAPERGSWRVAEPRYPGGD